MKYHFEVLTAWSYFYAEKLTHPESSDYQHIYYVMCAIHKVAYRHRPKLLKHF